MAADESYFIWDFDFFLGLCLPPKYQLLELAEKLNNHKPGHVIVTDSKWGAEESATLLAERGLFYLLSSKKNSPSYIYGDSLHPPLSKQGQHATLQKNESSGPVIAHSIRDSNATMNLFSNYIDGEQN